MLQEKPYPPPASPHHVIKTVEWMSEEIVDSITDKYAINYLNKQTKPIKKFCRILGDIPNTYAFTKALGEALVIDEMDNLPVVVLRPSVGEFFIPQKILKKIVAMEIFSDSGLEGTDTWMDGQYQWTDGVVDWGW